MRTLAVAAAILVASSVAACGGKQTRNASAPAPTVTGATTSAGATLPALQQEMASYVTSCANGGTNTEAFCRCVVRRLRATTTHREFLEVLQAGRTPPVSVQTKVRRATRGCRSKLG